MSRRRTSIVFLLAVTVALGAAAWQFTDSSHAIGLLSLKGGKARHPFQIESGHALYTLIMTGTVLPPYRGDIRIALEGSPAMNYAVYNSEPIVNLGFHRRPDLEGTTLRGVESGDRLALWVVMQPELVRIEGRDVPIASCCAPDPKLDRSSADSVTERPLTLTFYAAKSDQKLLEIPVVFGDRHQGVRHGSS